MVKQDQGDPNSRETALSAGLVYSHNFCSTALPNDRKPQLRRLPERLISSLDRLDTLVIARWCADHSSTRKRVRRSAVPRQYKATHREPWLHRTQREAVSRDTLGDLLVVIGWPVLVADPRSTFSTVAP